MKMKTVSLLSLACIGLMLPIHADLKELMARINDPKDSLWRKEIAYAFYGRGDEVEQNALQVAHFCLKNKKDFKDATLDDLRAFRKLVLGYFIRAKYGVRPSYDPVYGDAFACLSAIDKILDPKEELVRMAAIRAARAAMPLNNQLVEAIRSMDVEWVESALKAGADANFILEKEKGSPLLLALLSWRSGSETPVIKLLLEHGADVNFHKKGERTPLMIALEFGIPKVPELLLATKGIKLDAVFKGETVLDIAQRRNKEFPGGYTIYEEKLKELGAKNAKRLRRTQSAGELT